MRVLIVDGHSVIFAWPEMLKLHQRRTVLAREAVVKVLTEYQDSTDTHVVVVFDGKGAKWSETTEPGGIQVFYSGADQTADDIIERLAALYAEKHDITVATDDLLEQQTVSTFGAVCVSAEGLAAMLEEARTQFSRQMKKFRHREGPRSR
ncbi:MAG: uncharacterized protein QOD99_1271 [Chthoniobacter sp.]|jgi:predicted RNA-binding protein with PIN domain|nr:uncharacterized protein [Chthoniobacter sp.]